MPQPIAYLSFDGHCAEAVRFYAQVLPAKITTLMTNGQSPIKEHMPPKDYDRILNATLELSDNGVLMAGDAPTHVPYEPMKGFSLTLNYPTVAEAKSVFAKLSEGGTVTMPMMPAFWAEIFGMVTDRFGTPWIINGGAMPDLSK
jgi:PhnB protein